jgi:hypothetical protein
MQTKMQPKTSQSIKLVKHSNLFARRPKQEMDDGRLSNVRSAFFLHQSQSMGGIAKQSCLGGEAILMGGSKPTFQDWPIRTRTHETIKWSCTYGARETQER